MASPGNPNQAPSFDMNNFFKPPNPNPSQNPTNLTSSSSPYPLPPPSSSYPPPAAGAPFYSPQASPYHHLSNLHQQRSLSYPTPPLHPPGPNPNPNPNPNPGARFMALLSAPPPSTLELNPQHQTSSSGSEFPASASTIPAPIGSPAPVRMPSSKLPKGRHLIGDHVVYDIGIRLQGEAQPQLEVTPITKYVSDPQLVVGRQIAVNRSYICYGLKMGNIRILNINTALRSLLRGHTQRVTDMVFFAEDVHLLASVSIDGRVYVWKISEGPDEEDKPQITGKVVIALQIIGDGESSHPRVCWHCHKQEVLVVGIGKRVFRIDTTKVGKPEVYSTEEPLKCPIDRLTDGVQFVGKHDGEVTDLSMCQWMTTRLVSASMDGTIKVWEDRKAQPLLVLRPHDGRPVYSATFLTAPHRPDHIILVTAGPLNRELKTWVSAGEEGWLLPSDAESWHCTQTLDLKSSTESHVEEAFFNQVVALPKAGLLLLANAKKNAIYAIHLEYSDYPEATHMDYIAEFTVTMPILSFTGTSDHLPHGERIVQVYCVQTQAIQQYALDLTQCLPPPLENLGLEKSDSNFSRDSTEIKESSVSKSTEMPVSSAASKPPVQQSSAESTECGTPTTESKPVYLPLAANNIDIVCVGSSPPPLSPRLSGKLSGLQSPSSGFDHGPAISSHGGNEMDTMHTNLGEMDPLDGEARNAENKDVHDDISTVHSPPIMFKHPTHLVTPAEILMAVSSSDSTRVSESKSVPDVVINNDGNNVEVGVKAVGEARSTEKDEFRSKGEPLNPVSESKKKSFCSQASGLGLNLAKDSSALPESCVVEETRQVDGASTTETLAELSNAGEKGLDDFTKDVSEKPADSTGQEPPTIKGKKQKGKISQVSGPSSPSPTAFNPTDSSNESGVSSNIPSLEAVSPQIIAMKDMLNQLMTVHKRLQKQMTVLVTVPLTKEGRRLESAVGKNMEKSIKVNADALWARVQEQNAKQESSMRDSTQQLTSLIANFTNKDLPAVLEKTVKKEIAAIGPSVTRTITTSLEKTISSAIAETLQRGLADKTVNQLDKSVSSKLEAAVARQIQAQFQTSGKQALHDALRSTLESSLIPAFEMSCKGMFEQVDATFHKGMAEHTTAAQQQFESTHSPLVLALRDAIYSASSMTQTLSGEMADSQRNLLAFAASGANLKAVNPLVTQFSNGPLGNLHEKAEVPSDPTKELSRLISEHKFEEAFTGALQRSDVYIVAWLCSQVDLQGILSMVPLPLSQGVLLSLLQQLACDITNDTPRKLGWMTDIAVAINPADPRIAMHVCPIFEQVYQILGHHRSLPTTTTSEISSIRLVMHVINSMLTTCK